MGMHFLAITAGGFWVGACRLPGRYNNPGRRREQEEQEEHLAHWLRLLSALVCVCVGARCRLNCYIVCWKYSNMNIANKSECEDEFV